MTNSRVGFVYLLATLDTKGPEAALVRNLLAERGIPVKLVDTGCLGSPSVAADISREQVFLAAGEQHSQLVARGDRGAAINAAASGAARIVAEHYASGQVLGVLALGGSAGTTIGTAAMRALPLGVPKLMISTLASGEVKHYVGVKDIMMLNSVVDIAGINRISRRILGQAAGAMAGMVQSLPGAADDDKPLIAATMFGVTTPCVEAAKNVLASAGFEVVVFHATGIGGQAMESLINDGLVAGVLDITTTELADELVGGFLSAGPERLTAAGRRGVPQIVSVGATDMVNFHARSTVPERFHGRTFYQHNANVTLMRTTPEENSWIGADIGRKLSAAIGATSLLFPLRGVSAIDRAGQVFDDPVARASLLKSIKANAGQTEIIELDLHINDVEFALAAASRLIELIACAKSG